MAYITGTNGNDILTGSDLEDDFISGLDGNDTITGGLGSDHIEAGDGGDTVTGSFQDDSIYGDEGNDTLSGNSGGDLIDGGAGKDKLYGGSGKDTFTLGTLATAAGDVVDGGSGTDRLEIDYTLSTTKLNIMVKDWITPQTLPGGVLVTNVEEFRITGSRFADVMTAGNEGDVFYGGAGNDTLSGGRGADGLWGDEGNDVLFGNQGSDHLNGGEGNDKIYGGSQSDTLYGDEGADYLSGEAGNDTLDGGEGDDRLHGGSGDDQFDGGSGNNTIEGSSGNDLFIVNYFNGGAVGKDTITDSSGSDRLELNNFEGNFTAQAPSAVTTLANGTSFTGIEHFTIFAGSGDANRITTGLGNDTVQTFSGDDWINGGAGDDDLDGGDGKDTIFGGTGNDIVTFDSDGPDVGDGGAGTDTVRVDRKSGFDLAAPQTFSVTGTTAILTDGTTLKNFEHYVVSFGNGNDVVKSVGSALSVKFYGYGGNDTLIGTAGADLLDGGTGNDTLISGAGSDLIYDMGGINQIKSGDGADTVTVDGWGRADDRYTVDLGTGNDSFYRKASGGKLDLDGGAGTDFASINFSKSTTGITFKLAASVTATNAPVTVKNVERVALIGGSGNDVFTGGGLSDALSGGNGNDVLFGGGGNDIINGGLGNDTLRGGNGNDTIYGDGKTLTGGRDTIYAENGNDFVYMGIGDRANGGNGVDVAIINASEQSKDITFTFSTGTVNVDATTSFTAFEWLSYQGSKGKDTVTGSGFDDLLEGKSGNDILKGAGGNDFLIDGSGDDQLFGDLGNDTLIRDRQSGEDVFDGGAGLDTLEFLDFIASTGLVLDLMAQSKNKGLALGLTVKNIEIVKGSNYDDDIRGDAKANVLYGNDADDVLDGRDGNDTLVGGAGDDWLTGGKGNDTFVFDERDGEGDVITDFNRGQDKLVIDKSDYKIAKGDTAVTLVVGADPVATSTKGTFLFESDNGRLWFDADGKGSEANLELVAILQNVKTLSTSDFSFI